MDIKKYEYVIDVFKGTCELNNYQQSALVYKSGDLSNFEVFDSDGVKKYYNGLIYKDQTDCLMGAMNKLKPCTYTICEIINLGAKFLYNLDIETCEIEITSSSLNLDDVVDNLEALDLTVYKVDAEPSDGEEMSFSIVVDGQAVILGGVKEDSVYFECKYSVIEKVYDYKETLEKIDAYVYPIDEYSLSDAFIIGSNLKDAGFKVEIDYSMKQLDRDEIKATFLVTFDKEDIKKYEVKLIDLATNEVKTISIDNLIEELAFI